MMVGTEELEDVLENIEAARFVAGCCYGSDTTFYCHLFSSKITNIFFKM